MPAIKYKVEFYHWNTRKREVIAIFDSYDDAIKCRDAVGSMIDLMHKDSSFAHEDNGWEVYVEDMETSLER